MWRAILALSIVSSIISSPASAVASDQVKVIYVESTRPLPFKQLRRLSAVPLLKTSFLAGMIGSWNSKNPHHSAYVAVPADKVEAVTKRLAGRQLVNASDDVHIGVDIRMVEKKHQERLQVPVTALEDLKLTPTQLTLKYGSPDARALIHDAAEVTKIRITSWKPAHPLGGSALDGAVTLYPAE